MMSFIECQWWWCCRSGSSRGQGRNSEPYVRTVLGLCCVASLRSYLNFFINLELWVAASIDRSNFQSDPCIGAWFCFKMCAIAIGMLKYLRLGSSSSTFSGRQCWVTILMVVIEDLPRVMWFEDGEWAILFVRESILWIPCMVGSCIVFFLVGDVYSRCCGFAPRVVAEGGVFIFCFLWGEVYNGTVIWWFGGFKFCRGHPIYCYRPLIIS